jgi:hypothetical protein
MILAGGVNATSVEKRSWVVPGHTSTWNRRRLSMVTPFLHAHIPPASLAN